MILVTGGTGRLGGHVVRVLRQMGQPVRALVRKGSHYYWLNDTGCTYFFGDLRDPESLRRALRGVTHVVAASGITWETKDNNHLTVTLEGHRNLWEAAREAGVQHVVYVSAMGADRDFPVPWFHMQKKAEDALIGSGVSWTVLRAAPFTRTFAELARIAARRGVVWQPGAGTNQVAPIAVRDVAFYSAVALDHAPMANRVIPLCGPEAMSAGDALQRAVDIGGEGGTIRRVPGPGVKVAARALRGVGRRFEHRVKQLSTWFSEDFTADMAPLVAEVGIELTPFEQALRGDLDEIVPLEDPDARRERVVHRKFEATVYQPGKVPWSSLPSGPARSWDLDS